MLWRLAIILKKAKKITEPFNPSNDTILNQIAEFHDILSCYNFNTFKNE
jgi:hypothetical protein